MCRKKKEKDKRVSGGKSVFLPAQLSLSPVFFFTPLVKVAIRIIILKYISRDAEAYYRN